MKKYITTLTIAGSDCSGGAGIQADLKTFTALDCYGMSVITAVTAQNTLDVQAVKALPIPFINAQLDSIFQDILVNATKIGMLYNEKIILSIVQKLRQYSCKNIVLDPVMIAKSGTALLQSKAIHSLRKELFPMATLITPNIPEAELILQQPIRNVTEMQMAAQALSVNGCENVLLKGGHLSTKKSIDVLYLKKTKEWHCFTSPRINTKNTHGTGCTLSAAITAFLAKQFDLIAAIYLAKKYLVKALEAGIDYSLGFGCGPVNHLWNISEILITKREKNASETFIS